VLLVEDDVDLADALAWSLATRYDVVTAYDGRQGLEHLERERFDVLVLDLVMPRLDGEGLLEEARARGLELPVILSSGTPELATRGAALAVQAVLSKPYDLTKLVSCIERLTSDGGSGAPTAGGSPQGASRPPDGGALAPRARPLGERRVGAASLEAHAW
jgi:two-component system response regulator MprA